MFESLKTSHVDKSLESQKKRWRVKKTGFVKQKQKIRETKMTLKHGCDKEQAINNISERIYLDSDYGEDYGKQTTTRGR